MSDLKTYVKEVNKLATEKQKLSGLYLSPSDAFLKDAYENDLPPYEALLGWCEKMVSN